ncbi:BsuPI-related putative proteinase inhibitor [Sutcliffiella horikoshii]|uniref:BsuPI-related putative proteinase inhibitor n=1 Tax=Sutcliffiella horikoshii TaxID=79883 RepID=UPI001F20FE06|nr:BsuPI-related putative proteinase inhibitor [Sutcliffiella horikoshii]
MYKIILLLTVSMMLAACGTRGNSTQEVPIENNTSTGSEVPYEGEGENGDSDKSKDELKEKMKLEENKDGELNGQIERKDQDFLFTVTNNQEKDAEITFSSGQEYDYVVMDESGAVVKKLSEGMMYTQAMKEVILAPGEKLEYPVSYDDVTGDLAAGEYTIEFIFTGSNLHASAKETFTIE